MKSLKTQFETYLILKNFIQILKSFFLFSVFYSQPKIGILGCDRRRERAAGALGWQREEEEAGWAKSLGRENESSFPFSFFLFFKHFESFSNEFEFPFEIKQNQINSTQNMHQHECSSMYSNFDVDFILINLLFSLCLNAHTSKSKSI